MGVFDKFFKGKDKGNGDSGKSGKGQTTNNVGDVEKKLMSNILASQDVAGSLKGIKKDIIDGMGYGKLVEDAARITRAGTQQALDMAERLEKRKGHEINGSQSDESVSGNSIEVQQRLVKVVEEQLELMRSLPEMYTPEDIAKVEEELRKEQIKLDILTGADSKNRTIDSGEEAPENDDEWIKKWIDGYDTSQEYGLKRIIQELKKSKIMHYNEFGIEMGDEESDYKESFLERNESRDRYKKISLVYWQLQQMLKKCKERRRKLKTTTDPEPDERTPDRLGNPTELTPIEFATREIEELIREGIIEQEIADKCKIHIRDMELDDDENIIIEDPT